MKRTRDADAEVQRGIELHRQGSFEQARSHYRKALQIEPTHGRALRLLGVLALQMEQPKLALKLLSEAVQAQPNDAGAHVDLGSAYAALGRDAAAVAVFDRAISLDPGIVDAHFNRGNSLRNLGRNEEAVTCFKRALELNPDNPGAHNNLGIALYDLKRHDLALLSYNEALQRTPGYVDAHYNRGNALFALGRYSESLTCFECALKIEPQFPAAHLNRGSALFKLQRFQDAIESYLKVLALEPSHPAAYNNLGNAQQQLQRHEAAVKSYDSAIALQPTRAEAYYNRGNALRELKHYEAAIESFDRALGLDSNYKDLMGLRASAKTQICHWGGLQSDLALIEIATAQGEGVVNPFHFLSFSGAAQLQRSAAELWAAAEHPPDHALGPLVRRPKHERIRVGYFSSDLREHPVALLIAGVFEAHDRSQFEFTAFSFGPETRCAMRQRIERSFERFLNVSGKSDREIAQLARALEIDVAVDLNGYTLYGRPGIFALRAAPVQINYLGYPGTMGAPYMDYLIADRTVVPAGSERFYTEKLVMMPHSYQPNDDRRPVVERIYHRGDLNLPPEAFVFCCFNNNFKILPAMFDSWMRILKQVEGSVLWLLQDNPSAACNLKLEAASRQVDPRRLIFAPRVPAAEHLGRQTAADLFLDTLPYNGHTTASDALNLGLPVLTCTGEAFAGRVAASLLLAMQLPELVTSTLNDYEARALQLARDPKRLRVLREKLSEQRRSSPLFDARLSARHLEAAYRQIYERQQADLSPQHLNLDSLRS